MKSIVLLIISLVFASAALGQKPEVTGRITYISSGSVYTSIGSDAGVGDSSQMTVLSGLDTIAVLKVFATSSKSSACNIVNRRRELKVGETVIFTPVSDEIKTPPAVQSAGGTADTTSSPVAAVIAAGESSRSSSPDWLELHGSIGVQYQGTNSRSAGFKYSQSGGTINLRGRLTGLPVAFEIYGNFRRIYQGHMAPFSARGTDRTRIYRFSFSFDDGTHLISVGRIVPRQSPGIGYIDGLMATRSSGTLTLGFAAGFEPGYTQRTFFSNDKKGALFGSYRGGGALYPTLNISYARSYAGKLINRESLSGSLRIFPASRLSLNALCDLDLRVRSGGDFILSPRPALFSANIDYRFPSIAALGAGLIIWRPSYPFATTRAVPDSLLDLKVRTTPNISVSFYLPQGISVYNNYSPRLVSGRLGKEYLNYSSVSISDLFNSGFAPRISLSLNSTQYARSVIYGLSVQKYLFDLLDASLRYQANRNTISRSGDLLLYSSFSLDLLANLSGSVSLWGSVERFSGAGSDGYTILAEIRKKF